MKTENPFTNGLYYLEKIKGKLILDSNYRIIKLLDWNITEGSVKTITKKKRNIFGKERTIKSEVRTLWNIKIRYIDSEQIGTTWYYYKDFTEQQIYLFEDFGKKLVKCRERLLTMLNDFEKFGHTIK